MVTYNITFLQTNLTPLSAGYVVSAYENAPAGLSLIQAQEFANSNVPTASGTTSSAGMVSLSLDAGTLELFMVTGFNPVYATTPASSGNMYVIVYASTNVCIVYGTLLNQDGTPQVGVTVTANLNSSGPVVTNNLILATTTTTTTNTSGYYALTLIPNSLITSPRNTLYTFVFTAPVKTQVLTPFFGFGQILLPHGPSFLKIAAVPNVPQVDLATL